MSSSLLERARGFHEDLEIYERAIIEQLDNKPRTQKVNEDRDNRPLCERKQLRSGLFVDHSFSLLLPITNTFVSHTSFLKALTRGGLVQGSRMVWCVGGVGDTPTPPCFEANLCAPILLVLLRCVVAHSHLWYPIPRIPGLRSRLQLARPHAQLSVDIHLVFLRRRPWTSW